MPFTRRYLFWLIVPPAAVTIPIAFLFLSQVVQPTAGTAAIVLLLLVALYAAVGLVYARTLTGPLDELEAPGGDPSAAMSRALATTKRIAALAWIAGAVLFALIGMLLVMRNPLGLGYFAVAALLVGFPSTAWAYAAGKH